MDASFSGFRSGYLIRSNGVVTNLFIAHLFMLSEMLILSILDRITHVSRKLCERADMRYGIAYEEAEEDVD